MSLKSSYLEAQTHQIEIKHLKTRLTSYLQVILTLVDVSVFAVWRLLSIITDDGAIVLKRLKMCTIFFVVFCVLFFFGFGEPCSRLPLRVSPL